MSTRGHPMLSRTNPAPGAMSSTSGFPDSGSGIPYTAMDGKRGAGNSAVLAKRSFCDALMGVPKNPEKQNKKVGGGVEPQERGCSLAVDGVGVPCVVQYVQGTKVSQVLAEVQTRNPAVVGLARSPREAAAGKVLDPNVEMGGLGMHPGQFLVAYRGPGVLGGMPAKKKAKTQEDQRKNDEVEAERHASRWLDENEEKHVWWVTDSVLAEGWVQQQSAAAKDPPWLVQMWSAWRQGLQEVKKPFGARAAHCPMHMAERNAEAVAARGV